MKNLFRKKIEPADVLQRKKDGKLFYIDYAKFDDLIAREVEVVDAICHYGLNFYPVKDGEEWKWRHTCEFKFVFPNLKTKAMKRVDRLMKVHGIEINVKGDNTQINVK